MYRKIERPWRRPLHELNPVADARPSAPLRDVDDATHESKDEPEREPVDPGLSNWWGNAP